MVIAGGIRIIYKIFPFTTALIALDTLKVATTIYHDQPTYIASNTQELEITVPTHAVAQNSLRLLANNAVKREQELPSNSSKPRLEDNDYENDSFCPLFDTFYDCRVDASTQQMIDFDAADFYAVLGMLSEIVDGLYNVGPGCKSLFAGKGVLFMSLVALKHG